MKVKIAFFSLLLIATGATAQNYIYRGSQRIPATETWDFPTETRFSRVLKVTVGKNKTGGYLMLVAGVPVDNFAISGPVMIYLENGKVITLSQKVANDHLDGNSQVLYSIPTSAFLLLSEIRIVKIRYSIVDTWIKQRENYTAKNSKLHLYDYGSLQNSYESSYPTESEISQL